MASSHLGSSANSFPSMKPGSRLILPEGEDYRVVTLVRERAFVMPTHGVLATSIRFDGFQRIGSKILGPNAKVHVGDEMEFLSPLHLIILLLTALIIFGIPLLVLFLLARWLDKGLQRRPG